MENFGISELMDYEGIPVNRISDNVEETGAFIAIDKPYRWTSADVVRKVKVLMRQHYGLKKLKIGHSGTLDPLATGVLIICLGRKATRMVDELQSHRKTYVTEVRLGATTPCFDLEKEVDQIYPWEHITTEKVEEVLKGFIGEQDQIPPIYSAKSIEGKRAYDIARSGNDIELKASRITIWNAQLLSIDLPVVKVELECSKGTYIRSFGRDIGERLASGGHLISLRRTATGPFLASGCLSIENFEKIISDHRNKGGFPS